MTWLDFCQNLSRSHYFECPTGWLVFEGVRPGLSAWIHGASWEGRRGSHDEIIAPTRTLLQLFMRDQNLEVINAKISDYNKPVQHWLSLMGFERMGVVPLDDVRLGKPYNRLIFSLFRSDED